MKKKTLLLFLLPLVLTGCEKKPDIVENSFNFPYTLNLRLRLISGSTGAADVPSIIDGGWGCFYTQILATDFSVITNSKNS